jgi:hypothetical protein
VVIGAHQALPLLGRFLAGKTYVVYGKTGGYSSPFDLNNFPSSEDSAIFGALAREQSWLVCELLW